MPPKAADKPTSAASGSVIDPDDPCITRLQIMNGLVDKFDEADLLDHGLGNHSAWHDKIIEVLALSGGLEEYLDPEFEQPDAEKYPASARFWKLNDRHVSAFLRYQCSVSEASHLPAPPTSAASIWAAIEKRHARAGGHSWIRSIPGLWGRITPAVTVTPFDGNVTL